ncbi:hypothetical protein HYV22_01270 [Candidatus Gottesmanbacteria bacterium]|nr:hypothetical protein [Candidatus Gottesmanbacteria bacterium]
MKIAIIYSVPTKRAVATQYLAADEDTKVSAEKVSAAMLSKGHDPRLIPITEDSIEKISKISADCMVNLIEWSGLDLPLNFQAVKAMVSTGIPFTGGDVTNLHITSDKVSMKTALDAHHLPTSKWQHFTTGAEAIRDDFSYPVIVKLALEHCSVGLSNDAVVSDKESLARLVKNRAKEFGQPIVAEEFITGRELQVTVLDRPQPQGLSVLPPAEIFFSTAQGFLTYGGRWDEKHPDYNTSSIGVAKLTPPLAKKIDTIARTTFKLMKFCDYARLDIRVRDRDMFILEANSNPGLDDDPEYGMTVSYKAIGMTFTDFIWEIIESCLRRSVTMF